MKEIIYNLDLDLFYFINQGLRNDFFDIIMPFLRAKYTWIPLYAVILYFIFKKYKTKGFIITGFAIITILISDQLSSSLIKPFFERARPCNNYYFEDWINLPIGKGSGWSFVSSHASNHFALAFYFSYFLGGFRGKLYIALIFFVWASLISFAQVYIGFHYPVDVFCGALLGISIAFFVIKICLKILKILKIIYN